MKKMLAALALAVFLMASNAWAQRILRLAHGAAPGNPRHEAALLFADLVAKKTAGRLKVEVGGNAQYGNDVEALTDMRLGTLAFSANSQGPAAGIVPQFALLGLPFLFTSLPQAWAVLDGPVGDRLGELAEQKGLVLLALWDNGIRDVSNNIRPIRTPADLHGMKLRVPSDPMTIDIFQALGADPTPIAFSELYIALQQGVVDGEENPLMNIDSSKLYEVQKYISLTRHKYESTPLLASKVVWDALSGEDQEAIREAAGEAGRVQRGLSQTAGQRSRAKMEAAGVAFNTVEPAPFIEATKAVYDKWGKDYPAFTTLVRKEAATKRTARGAD